MAGNPYDLAARAAEAAVKGDSELAEAARALANTVIQRANFYLEHGSPATQLQVIKALMPAIGRGMTEKGENDEIAELRQQLMELHQAVLGASVA